MAIYRFTDTIERALRSGYPAEALNFNGIYFEDEIEGYQTLSVSGREALEAEVDYIETKARHGAKYRSSRYLPRVITVRYKIRAKDSSDLIEKYNRLNYLLGVEEARLIFQDEPDKFWIGTRRSLAPPEEGLLTTTGEIEFLCTDPFKYSVKKYEVAAVDGAITTHYNGTVPNPPAFRIHANSDTALVEFLKDVARIGIGMRIDPSKEISGMSNVRFSAYSEMSLAPVYTHGLAPCFQDTTAIFWKEGELGLVPGTDFFEYAGRIEYQTELIAGEEWLIPFRTADFDHSCIIRPDGIYTIETWGEAAEELAGQPAETPGRWSDISAIDDYAYQSGEYRARGTGLGYVLENLISQNFTFSFEAEIYSGHPTECGAQSFAVYAEGTRTAVDDNDVSTEETYRYPAFGLGIRKTAIGTNRLELTVYVDGNIVDTIVMPSLESNEVFGKQGLPCTMSRFGRACTLRLGNESYAYTAVEAVQPAYVGIYVCDYVGAPKMACNAIRYVSYEEQTADTAKGVRNIIRNGSDVIVDCAAADIMVNGISEPAMGDIANEWDAMELLPGDNSIAVIAIADNVPEVIMEYREAYI